MWGYQHGMISEPELWALALSTFAGLSTTVGAGFAVVRQPDDSMLAFLLGLALGVMATLSIVELWIKNALDNGLLPVSAAVVAGAALFYVAHPFFPEVEISQQDKEDMAQQEGLETTVTAGNELTKSRKRTASTSSAPATVAETSERRSSIPPAELFRLGLLMAVTMTLHNMPEGLAVAFSSYTDFGAVMAVAIAMHNIPEGIIVAAPIYAATGSRSKALLIATASGLSEPVGALLALVFVKPFLTPERLHYMLAFTGGIMLAVCVIELWPEARKCRRDVRAWQGIALGSLLMGVTLLADV